MIHGQPCHLPLIPGLIYLGPFHNDIDERSQCFQSIVLFIIYNGWGKKKTGIMSPIAHKRVAEKILRQVGQNIEQGGSCKCSFLCFSPAVPSPSFPPPKDLLITVGRYRENVFLRPNVAYPNPCKLFGNFTFV